MSASFKAVSLSYQTNDGETLAEFNLWANEMTISPVIQEFKATLDQIRQREINRYLKNLTEEENRKVQVITKDIIQKILELPVLQLKAACQRGEAHQLSEGLRALFNLEAKKGGAEA